MTISKTIETNEDTTLFESIANDIAAKGYSISPYSLPESLSELLFEHIQVIPAENFKRAGTGRATKHQLNDFVRTDEICWIIGESAAGSAWINWADAFQRFLNRRLFLGLFSFESHFSHYAKGDFYKKHKDAFRGGNNRVLSVVVYLNKSWLNEDGGELVIYNSQSKSQAPFDGKSIRVTPAFGTIVVFLSEDFPHEVLPTARDRYSIAGWFRLNNSK